MSEYGFCPMHHILLEGVTILPEKKNDVARSLGPLTSLVCLAMSKNDQKCSKIWQATVKKNLAFIPEIDSIINLCCGKKSSEVKELYSIIANILLVTTSCESNKSSFPACMLYMVFDDPEIKHYILNGTICEHKTDIE